MMLIARNRTHPRELTYLAYETWTSEIPGWPKPSQTQVSSRLRTVVDETLAQYPVIWAAAGTPDSVMPLTYDQLLAVTEGVAVRVR
jgi:hypothetical protein